MLWYEKQEGMKGDHVFRGVTRVCLAKINNARTDEDESLSMHILNDRYSGHVMAHGEIVVDVRQFRGRMFAHASLRMRDVMDDGRRMQYLLTLDYWSGPQDSPIDSLMLPCLPVVTNFYVVRMRPGQSETESYDPRTVVTSISGVVLGPGVDPDEFLAGDLFAEYRLT